MKKKKWAEAEINELELMEFDNDHIEKLEQLCKSFEHFIKQYNEYIKR